MPASAQLLWRPQGAFTLDGSEAGVGMSHDEAASKRGGEVPTLFFFPRDGVSLCCQAGVQWHDLGSLQPLPPGFSDFPVLAS